MEAIIIILIILILILLFKRTFSSVIYSIVIVDVFLRLVDFLKTGITFEGQLGTFFNSIPASLSAVITHTTGGIISTLLLWVLFIVYVLFEYYIIDTFLKKH